MWSGLPKGCGTDLPVYGLSQFCSDRRDETRSDSFVRSTPACNMTGYYPINLACKKILCRPGNRGVLLLFCSIIHLSQHPPSSDTHDVTNSAKESTFEPAIKKF